MAALQGRLTGIALPKLICDTPGGRGKVPLVPDYVVAARAGARRCERSGAKTSSTSIRLITPAPIAPREP